MFQVVKYLQKFFKYVYRKKQVLKIIAAVFRVFVIEKLNKKTLTSFKACKHY